MIGVNGAQEHGEGILRVTRPIPKPHNKRVNENMSKLCETVGSIRFILEIAEGLGLPLKTWGLAWCGLGLESETTDRKLKVTA